ncbi:Fpg/Nei family DNA glycosylase [Methanocella arvoryzae]|uniref:Formamidopyrimidine-DNA glycosylase n=1 Tax=Methanocella arvoryzae (strain DSM 22066 / NBRC 105507 / MRE50) TaxID=351160 RepID=Q0W7A0_METAR|nr:DNA-formamidopyrimidine glycosylase family protein [Methanocella arvoryzae]CAH04791.1 formamidopyrimidine-DNA glycosylase [uncultured archaeon]CAJ35743.1 formamidopyrimidine-DNA glycosylase [Methanocella arvoryzae MRE50]
MPELPEIYNLAMQMNKELQGKTIADIEIVQEKCLNVNSAEFRDLLTGKRIGETRSRGKWIFTAAGEDRTLLLNLGMGGDVLYHRPGSEPEGKYKLKFTYTDASALSINFWWFGYVHIVKNNELKSHKMTSALGISPIEPEFTFDCFKKLLSGKRCSLKTLLLDQKIIAGIGNVYAQDILFTARLHPDRKVRQLSDDEIERLFKSIIGNLHNAAAHGGLKFEKDLYGHNGSIDSFLVGYKEGQPCPVCNTTIEKIKTGSTASYICPKCQL